MVGSHRQLSRVVASSPRVLVAMAHNPLPVDLATVVLERTDDGALRALHADEMSVASSDHQLYIISRATSVRALQPAARLHKPTTDALFVRACRRP